MIASSTPGMTLEVLRADVAARARVAEERRQLVAMARELGTVRSEARRARWVRRLMLLRGHPLPHLGHHRPDSRRLTA